MNSNWQWLHPKPQGNTLRWCKMWNNNLWFFLGDFGTFVRTTNGGLNWIINNQLGRYVSSKYANLNDGYFFNQNTGIVVGDNATVLKTTNGGETFDSIPGLAYNLSTGWKKINFINVNTGYIAGSSPGTVTKTTNSGLNWSRIESLPSNPWHYYDVDTPNDTLLLIASINGYLQRSTDGGTSWSAISTSLTGIVYRVRFLNRDTVFACGQSGVCLSTDAGLNWVSISNGIPQQGYLDIDISLNSNSTMYLTGDGSCIFKTTNLGSTWDSLSILGTNQANMGNQQKYYSSSVMGNDTILTVGSYGLINKRNGNSGNLNFSDFRKFGPDAIISDLWINENSIWAIGWPTIPGTTNDQILFSSNGGIDWDIQQAGNPNEKFEGIQMLNSNLGYIVGIGGVIRRTTNGGNSWDAVQSPTADNLGKVVFVNENTGWVFGGMFGLSSTIYKTTNGALSWIQQTAPALPYQIFDAHMVNENTGWITGQIGIRKTTNGGENWFPQSPNTGNSWIINVDMLNENTGYISGYNHIRKTTNGGIDWETITPPGLAQFNAMDFINENTGMLIYSSASIKTTNGGNTWLIENFGTSSGVTNSEPSFLSAPELKMTDSNTAFLCGYYASILKYSPQSPIGIIEWQNVVPKKYILFQNYPNPFNPSTTIKFGIPKQGKVLLKVYDIAGREVRTVINMELNAGTVTHQFDGNELASGIYFYSLYIDGSLMDTKKMVIIK